MCTCTLSINANILFLMYKDVLSILIAAPYERKVKRGTAECDWHSSRSAVWMIYWRDSRAHRKNTNAKGPRSGADAHACFCFARERLHLLHNEQRVVDAPWIQAICTNFWNRWWNGQPRDRQRLRTIIKLINVELLSRISRCGWNERYFDNDYI